MISIVVPAFNEAVNLPRLYQRLVAVMDRVEGEWELIIVDDHSSDGTFPILEEMAQKDTHVRAYRFSRNFGSHTAIRCGLDHARGNSAVILAADLQDPPELIPELIAEWRKGNDVVWAVRNQRSGEKTSTVWFAQFYYFIMRKIVGITAMPLSGSDFFILDQKVFKNLMRFAERNASIFALIAWMGFRQSVVSYNKEARAKGRSGWTLKKKLKLLMDSIASFSFFPIHFMSCLGFIIAAIGFLYAILVIVNGLIGKPQQGWSSLMVVVLVVGGIQMLMMGLLGEYLWRSLDETRQRPRYLIERGTPDISDLTESSSKFRDLNSTKF